MFSLLAFYESQDPAGVLVNIAALVDPIISTNGDDLTVPEFEQIVAIAAGVPSGGDGFVRLDAPSLLRKTRFFIGGTNGQADADAEADDPPLVMDLRRNPLRLQRSEDLNAAANYNTTIARAAWVLMAFADGIPTPAQGEIFTIRGQADAAVTADVWSNQTITLDENLPAGRYAVVGMRAVGADLIAARLVFRGTSAGHRPGCLAVVTDGGADAPIFRNGELGIWGEFEHNLVPSVDLLAHSATSDHDLFLDLIQVRSGPA